MFGEDNRCSSCNAIAAAVPKGQSFRCLACGKPRTLKPGTVVFGGAGGKDAGSLLIDSRTQRGIGWGSRFIGITGIVGGILLSVAAAAVLPGVVGYAVAAVVAMGGVGTGMGALYAGKRSAEAAEERRAQLLAAGIMQLAERNEGQLLATQVAREYGMSIPEADEALTRLVDGQRVTLEVSPDGILVYHFHEVRALAEARVKVMVTSEEPAEVESAAAASADSTATNSNTH